MTNLAFDFDVPPPLPDAIAIRIAGARASGKMTECENDVLNLLADFALGARLGRSKAMSIATMQAIWQRHGTRIWSDRAIKSSVKRLLEIMEVPIGSSRGECNGYFLVADDEDLRLSERALRGELVSIARRLKSLNPKSTFARTILGQLQMEANLDQAQ